MAKKKPVQKPEVQPDLPETVDPLLQAQEELKTANELIVTLQNENVKLLEQAEVEVTGFDAVWKTTVDADAITRNDVIKALLPQINMKHARPSTQQLLRAIDEVCVVLEI